MKRISYIQFLIVILSSSIVCCGVLFLSQKAQSKTVFGQDRQLDGVTLINSETKPDAELESAFSKEFGIKRGEEKVHYYYNRVDLNGDEVPETFVYLTGPFFCGTGGCSGLVLERADSGYKVKSRFSLVRTPVIVSETKTNGWKDLIMYVAGGGIEPSYRVLKFDGKKYPLNPSAQPKVESSNLKGIGVISDDVTAHPGIVF